MHIAALLPFFAGSALRLPWQFSSVRSFFPDSIAAGRFSLIFVSSLQFLHDTISLYTYVRTSFSGPCRCVCVPLILLRARRGIVRRVYVGVVYTHLPGPVPRFGGVLFS